MSQVSKAARSRSVSPLETALIALVIAALFGAALLSGHPGSGDVRLSRVQVRSGDSLWALAKQFPVDGLTTAQTVELIAEKNGLTGVSLSAGSSIMVPAHALTGAVASR